MTQSEVSLWLPWTYIPSIHDYSHDYSLFLCEGIYVHHVTCCVSCVHRRHRVAGNLQEVPLSMHEPASDVVSDVRGPGLEDGSVCLIRTRGRRVYLHMVGHK